MSFSPIVARSLLVRAGGLGDVLLLRQALQRLRLAGHSPWLWVPSRYGSALLSPGEAGGILDWDSAETARVLADPDCASEVFDGQLSGVVGAIAYSREPALVRALRRVATTSASHPPLPPPGRRASDWYEDAVMTTLGLPRCECSPGPCQVLPEEREAALGLLPGLPDGFLAIHPGSGSSTKNWPAERFAHLARALSAGRPWLLLEGPAEQGGTCRTLREVRGALALHEPPLRLLGALLARARLYVGNDSGVTHLAAAWGAPTLALYGPTDPAVWAPVGRDVRVLRGPRSDMRSLTVEEVEGVARAMWSRPVPPCG